MSLLPNCKEAHQMVLAAQDQSLPLYRRVLLRLHLGICDSCTNFRRQIDFIRVAMRRAEPREDD
ncbi:MAG: anti-sigma factor [Burkholderiaceae bacterium]|nr:MAG: anti-sigma factor [Burkholderiaceae bacterium]